MTCSTIFGTIHIDVAKAEGNVHAAPADQQAGFTYPHEFRNIDVIEWPNSKPINWPNDKCNGVYAKRAQPQIAPKLLEFPVLPDGHLFPWNQPNPPADPGPVRAVFTFPDKVFCGVMVHDGIARNRHNPQEGANEGPFKLCTRRWSRSGPRGLA